jgi:alpha-glucosidase (family GH31 glycosyl hydrolase)
MRPSSVTCIAAIRVLDVEVLMSASGSVCGRVLRQKRNRWLHMMHVVRNHWLRLAPRIVKTRDGEARGASPVAMRPARRFAIMPPSPRPARLEGDALDPHLRLHTSPLAHPDAVVQGDRFRITVLADGLLRLEWAEDGAFEDRASTFAIHRDLPVPQFDVVDGEAAVEIVTQRLRLTYDRGPFSPAGLSVRLRGNVTNYRSVWRYDEPVRNLGGTTRTLDDVDGRAPLEPGILSRVGIAELDDSRSFLFEDGGWVSPRPEGRIDTYVFAYGHDYADALRAFYAVSGRQPVLPRWTLGNWWSRYHRYSADSYLALMDRFEEEGLPFSVAVIDMDWHRVESVPERYGSGWTGYSWERSLFPDPEGFLSELHRRGLRVTLNVHPADGVRAFEDAYPAMAKALGLEPDGEEPIAFDITDPAFLDAYLKVLHQPLEEQGVDFWWIDWQQGRYSRIASVDPLWMLNHFHFLDSGRGGRRPLTFSRYAGPGSHRYPIGFSGDAHITWASLQFQPEFTATASNIGYGWWSHDIGGHIFGVRDDELATRWVQYGVFAPILRLHSSSNPFLVKEPWMYPGEARDAMTRALRFRHRLVPYLHTMNHRAAVEGVPLVRPMYHLAPRDPRAYTVPNQFAFGSELIVAPVTTPRDRVTLRGEVRAWLPAGAWIDLFTGTAYDGDRELDLYRDGDSIPALLRAGGILPLAAEDDLDATRNPERLEVLVAPGADGAFTLVEDDGTGASPDDIPTAKTAIAWRQDSGELTIAAADDPHGVLPRARTWRVTFVGVRDDATLRVERGGSAGEPVPAQGRASVTVRDVPAGEAVRVVADVGEAPLTHDRSGALFAMLNAAQFGHEAKVAAWRTLTSQLPPAAMVAELHAQDLPRPLIGALSELLTARG